MLSSLHPHSLGELLDRTLRIYRANFKTLIFPVVIIQIVMVISYGVTQRLNTLNVGSEIWEIGLPQLLSPFTPLLEYWLFGDFTVSLNNTIWSISALLFVLIITLPLLIRDFALLHLGVSNRASHPHAYVSGGLILAVLLLFVAGGLCILPGLYLPSPDNFVALFSSPLLFWSIIDMRSLLIVLPVSLMGFIVYTMLSVAPCVAILEQVKPLTSLRRSWQLVRSSFWRVATMVVMLGVLMQCVGWLPRFFVIVILSTLNPGISEIFIWGIIFALVLVQFGMMIYLPIQVGAFTILYYDLRVRHEGYDLLVRQQYLSNTDDTRLVEQSDTQDT